MEVFLRRFDNAFLDNSFLDGFLDQDYNYIINERMVLLPSIKQHFKIQNMRLLKNVEEYILTIEDLRQNRCSIQKRESKKTNVKLKKSSISLNKTSLSKSSKV